MWSPMSSASGPARRVPAYYHTSVIEVSAVIRSINYKVIDKNQWHSCRSSFLSIAFFSTEWLEFDESRYLINRHALENSQANTVCSLFGGVLASVTSKREYEFLESNLRGNTATTRLVKIHILRV